MIKLSNAKKVLIVDDNSYDVELTMRATRNLADEFEFVVAYDGEAALRIVATISVDLIFLDINMPKVNGFEFLNRFNQAILIPPPIVIVSNSNRAEDIDRALSLGASAFVRKEFDFKNFSSEIRRILLSLAICRNELN